MIGVSSPGNSYLTEQLADLHLDQLEQLLVVDHVHLIKEDDDARHADLAHEQDVLARLRHGAVGRGHDEHRAVHLRRAGDHVLDVVGVTGAVHVRVVSLGRLVLLMRDGDRNPALFLLGSVVDLIDTDFLRQPLGRKAMHDCRGQRRLTVIDVTGRPDVYVGLGALEFCFAI